MVAKPAAEMRECVGCLQVHTAYGEGTEKLPAIIRAANEAGLDFLVVTDVNTLHCAEAGLEGWSDQTAVIVGEEVAGRGGHCLALGVKRDVSAKRDDPSAFLADIREQEGVSVISHCHAPPEPFATGVNRRWKDWGIDTFDAIELWSFFDDWKTGVTRWNLRRRAKRPAQHLRGPDEATLAQWDAMLRRRRTAALASLDARGLRRRPKTDLMLFSHRELFDTLRVHLMTPPFTRRFFDDKRAILEALRRGQCFLANDGLAPAHGFEFSIRCPDGSAVHMGQEATFKPGMTLQARLPQRAHIRLITDGVAWLTNTMSNFDLELNGAGVIRLEARLGDHPWIFTNPIYLRPATPEMVGS